MDWGEPRNLVYVLDKSWWAPFANIGVARARSVTGGSSLRFARWARTGVVGRRWTVVEAQVEVQCARPRRRRPKLLQGTPPLAPSPRASYYYIHTAESTVPYSWLQRTALYEGVFLSRNTLMVATLQDGIQMYLFFSHTAVPLIHDCSAVCQSVPWLKTKLSQSAVNWGEAAAFVGCSWVQVEQPTIQMCLSGI